VQNALLSYLGKYQPEYDLVGPTVDDDLRRIIKRYGRDAVLDAIKREGKKKRGRKAQPDWPELSKVLEEDARTLLEGGDPFPERTNYSIATAYAEANPGHSRAATHRRILRKLSQKRVILTLLSAHQVSHDQYPFEAHLGILRRIDREKPDWAWSDLVALAETAVRDYTAKHGPPEPAMTMKEIENGAREIMLPERGSDGRPAGGIFGLLGSARP